ncbi:MAG: hypothetical protein D3914_14160 [Candidatus Electrothrix sp. LOE2]|nr:hypothetical protein [Candidatus Electrothrix sp. LOE2]
MHKQYFRNMPARKIRGRRDAGRKTKRGLKSRTQEIPPDAQLDKFWYHEFRYEHLTRNSIRKRLYPA